MKAEAHQKSAQIGGLERGGAVEGGVSVAGNPMGCRPDALRQCSAVANAGELEIVTVRVSW